MNKHELWNQMKAPTNNNRGCGNCTLFDGRGERYRSRENDPERGRGGCRLGAGVDDRNGFHCDLYGGKDKLWQYDGISGNVERYN